MCGIAGEIRFDAQEAAVDRMANTLRPRGPDAGGADRQGRVETRALGIHVGDTLAMQDSSGPFDWHLTRLLLELSAAKGIDHTRDVFLYCRSDAASAIEAGNDIRTALVCLGLDASHGHKRVHLDSLDALARLLIAYLCGPPLFQRDRMSLEPLDDFSAAEVQISDWQGTPAGASAVSTC